MARKTKNTVDYFPHYALHKKTLTILESKYGNDGYATLFKILELLCVSENHFYVYNNPLDKHFCIHKCNLEEKMFTEIVELLVELGTFDKELRSVGIIYSQNLVDNLDKVYERRKSNPLTIKELKDIYVYKNTPQEDKCIHDVYRNEDEEDKCAHDVDKSTQSKVKESIVEESKENHIGKNENSPTGEHSLQSGQDDDFSPPPNDQPPEPPKYGNEDINFITKTLLEFNGGILSDTKKDTRIYAKHLFDKLYGAYGTDWKDIFYESCKKISGDEFYGPSLGSVQDTYRKIGKIVKVANTKHRDIKYPVEMEMKALLLLDKQPKDIRMEVIRVLNRRKEQGFNHLKYDDVNKIVETILETKTKSDSGTGQQTPKKYNPEALQKAKTQFVEKSREALK